MSERLEMPKAPKGYTPPKLTGLGDAVALVAKPIAKGIDAVLGTSLQDCGGCAARQQRLNAAVPFCVDKKAD